MGAFRILRRRRLVLVVVLAVEGCSPDTEGVGGACVTSADCRSGERCVDARCVSHRPDGSVADGALPTDAGSEADAGAVGSGCSADLRDVLDATGATLLTCPPDQGCAGGRCIDACTAAAVSGGNVGCRFVVATPPSYPPALPPCFAAFLTSAWPAPATVTVRRGATTLDPTSFARLAQSGRPETEWSALPAGGIPTDAVAVVFLSSDPGSVMPETGVPLRCPVTPAVDESTVVSGTGSGEPFVIETSMPVSAYDVMPYGGAPSHFPSAELLLPATANACDYVVIGSPPGTASPPGPMWLQVAAIDSETSVRIRPTVDLPAGGGLPALPAATISVVTIPGGTYAQWELPAGAADLSGTVLSTNAPVAVFSGNRFLRLQPTPGPGGDSTHQEMLPLGALSDEYVAAPYETRRADLAPEPIGYRLVGAFDGTILAYEPAIPGVPATLDQGQIADFETELPFVVRSQDDAHPFAASQLMTTANFAGADRPGTTWTHPSITPRLGDEEWVVMFPPAQFLSRYVFFTDPSYGTTNLVLTRIDRGAGFAPVTVDCLGDITGWHAVGASGGVEVTTVDLVRAGAAATGCDNGRHVATSDAPFGLVVWGLDTYSSYAYPAGGNAATLAELPPLF